MLLIGLNLIIFKIFNKLKWHNTIELLLCNVIDILIYFIKLLKVITKELYLIIVLNICLIYILFILCKVNVLNVDLVAFIHLVHQQLIVYFLLVNQQLILILNYLLLLLLQISCLNICIVVYLVVIYQLNILLLAQWLLKLIPIFQNKYIFNILTFQIRYIIGLKSKGSIIPPFELDFPPHLYIDNSLKYFAIN